MNATHPYRLSWGSKTVLVTGATGSFGRSLVEKLIQDESVSTIRCFSRDELKQWQMKRDLPSPKLRFLIGDVRDSERLESALAGVDIVVHAAAMKQVPACTYNPFEAVKTNILGTQNVISACVKAQVKMAVFLSSDKAVDPVNLYGATKLVAEQLWLGANQFSDTTFAVTRWGNVIGSRGSAVELFVEQAKTGEVTITDPSMTRFWISLDAATDFLWGVVGQNQPGIFTPALKSSRVVDVAKLLAPKAKLNVIGIRQGEKLHETLGTNYFSNDKARLMGKKELSRVLRQTLHSK